jgi:UDP-glucose 4-epimerase
MRTLVTGSEGLIGSYLVEELIELGNDVVTLDLLPSKRKGADSTHLQLDLRDPRLGDLLADLRVNRICHLAAEVDVISSISNPVSDANTNILGTLNLIQASISGHVEKIVYSNSGGAIYFPNNGEPHCEDSLVWPISPYGISKLAAEMYLMQLLPKNSIQFTSLALANVYGPRHFLGTNPKNVIDKWMHNAKEGGVIEVRSRDAVRDFIYVKDVVSAFIKALGLSSLGRVNIGTGKGTSLGTLLELLQSLHSSKLRIEDTEWAEGEQMSSILCCCKAFTVLDGWEPKTSIDQGLRSYL